MDKERYLGGNGEQGSPCQGVPQFRNGMVSFSHIEISKLPMLFRETEMGREV
jgi:hypothetical protein